MFRLSCVVLQPAPTSLQRSAAVISHVRWVTGGLCAGSIVKYEPRSKKYLVEFEDGDKQVRDWDRMCWGIPCKNCRCKLVLSLDEGAMGVWHDVAVARAVASIMFRGDHAREFTFVRLDIL